MTIRNRVIMAAALGAAFLSLLVGASAAGIEPPAPPDPQDCTIRCVAYSMDIKLASLPGTYVAMHFLKADVQGRAAIGTYVASVGELAGVQHVFVAPESSDDYTMIAKSGTAAMLHFTVDDGGKLASRFNIQGDAGAVVVLDRDRRELWRESGTTAGPMQADGFVSRMKGAWRASAIAEYNLSKGSSLAVQGHDVVAYFIEAKARKGEERFATEYQGVTYRFASKKNRDRFVNAPERYLPTYGGWCASAIGAKGEKVEIDPTNFKVKDGRLFLFYKSIFADALKDWNKHEKDWEPAADANWKRIAGEDPIKPAATGTK